MTRGPGVQRSLLALLRAGGGTSQQQISTALDVLVEQLDLDTAFVSRFEGGQRHVVAVVGRSPSDPIGPVTQDESVCHLAATGAVARLVPDVSADPVLAGHPHTSYYRIGAWVGVPLTISGHVVGAVCGIAQSPRPGWTSLDGQRLNTVGTHIAELIAHAQLHPEQDTEPVVISGLALSSLAGAVADSPSLEDLARPLLQLLHQLTGMESTYLTSIDWSGNEQRVDFSLNLGDMQIPEGLTVDFQDTLCRLSLSEGRQFTADVPSTWGDSAAAKGLGIRSFVSVPIHDADDAVIGTLCGSSAYRSDLNTQHLQAMHLFARILSDQAQRERTHAATSARVAQLEQRTRQLTDKSTRDSLTGLANRDGIHAWLRSVIPELDPGTDQLAVAFIDVDHFKSINDTYGHAFGDHVLQRIATSLTTVGRIGDLHGRLGGDEFVVAARLPATSASLGNWSSRLLAVAAATHDDVRVTATVGVTSITDPTLTSELAVLQADQAMYRIKKTRPARTAK